jgi:hypothetical protein
MGSYSVLQSESEEHRDPGTQGPVEGLKTQRRIKEHAIKFINLKPFHDYLQ